MITCSTSRCTSARSTGASFMKFGRAPTTERTRMALLHRDALREIARPIHGAPAEDGDVIRQQLERDDRQHRGDQGWARWHRNLVIHEVAQIAVALARDRDEAAAFFFQAEDGIRDVAVTGVQTCALPI